MSSNKRTEIKPNSKLGKIIFNYVEPDEYAQDLPNGRCEYIYGDPLAEPLAAALVLEAEMRLVSADGRRSVPADGFFLGPLETAIREDELLEAVAFRRALPGERRTDGLGIDVGIAVHVAADPRSEMHDVRNLDVLAFLAINTVDGRAYVLVKRGHRAIQDVGYEEQHVLQFVRDRHAFGGVFRGLPAGRREQSNVLQRGVGLLRRHGRVEHVDQVFDDVLFLAQDRAAGCLRRVCRKHGLDRQRVEQRLQAFRVEAGRLEFHERVFESARLVDGDVAQVFSPPADAMHFLGGVHHLEIGRETAHELRGGAGFQVPDQRHEFFAGFLVTFAPPDRTEPRIFDHLEQRFAVLLSYEFADHRAERANVVAQGLVLLLEGDVLATQGFMSRGIHCVCKGTPGRRPAPPSVGANSRYFAE